ncbi:MAG: T9SS type A sorting domain-containing protein [Candidatus Aegiribacteria sp.]|nr:T9SS type A sorting domain-containing protein [Candidatus Aegiribacteria sp.]
MIALLFILLPCIQGTMEAEVNVPNFPYIPINVVQTWQVAYASDIQDVSFDWNSNLLIIRSNGDGKLYLADPYTCEYAGEIDLPSGAEGFGVGYDNGGYSGRYYINSSTSSQIYHSDGSDTWSEFSNPAGTDGAGIDFNAIMMDGILFQASAVSPYQFYSINPGSGSYDIYELSGVNGEISGFMVHEVFTLSAPYALILTTRYGHEFFFYWLYGEYVQYGQEPCPMPVSESLGLSWSNSGAVYWSYKGVDQEYYISMLQIPVFGGIEDEQSDAGVLSLSVISNPSIGSASLSVNLTAAGPVTLEIFDLTGRLQEVLNNGQLASGENIFAFSGPPGLYIAVLRNAGNEARSRFVLLR